MALTEHHCDAIFRPGGLLPAFPGFMRIPTALVPLLMACSSTAPEARPIDRGESIPVQTSCPAPAPVVRTAVRAKYLLVCDAGRQSQRLDIAQPVAGGVHPLVVLIHGGSWSFGSRSNLRTDMFNLASRGYVAAAIDYRLTTSPANILPAAVQDVRCAARWLRSEQGRSG